MAYIERVREQSGTRRPFHEKSENQDSRETAKGIPLATGPNHTVRLEVTDEALTVHTGLSLFYAMAEALEIPRILDERVKVKQRESGYPESEHILALAANAFVGGDYLEDLEALREDVAIQRVIGRKDLPIRRQRGISAGGLRWVICCN